MAPTKRELAIINKLAENVSAEFQKYFRNEPPVFLMPMRKILLDLIENQTRPKTLIVLIEKDSRHVGVMADEMANTMLAESDHQTTLGELLAELQKGIRTVKELIGQNSETTFLDKLAD